MCDKSVGWLIEGAGKSLSGYLSRDLAQLVLSIRATRPQVLPNSHFLCGLAMLTDDDIAVIAQGLLYFLVCFIPRRTISPKSKPCRSASDIFRRPLDAGQHAYGMRPACCRSNAHDLGDMPLALTLAAYLRQIDDGITHGSISSCSLVDTFNPGRASGHPLGDCLVLGPAAILWTWRLHAVMHPRLRRALMEPVGQVFRGRWNAPILLPVFTVGAPLAAWLIITAKGLIAGSVPQRSATTAGG